MSDRSSHEVLKQQERVPQLNSYEIRQLLPVKPAEPIPQAASGQ
jgi:hypothetical protein